MEIQVGDRYQVTNQQRSVLWTSDIPPIYTVTKIEGRNIHWDCIGRKIWYKIVDRSVIEQHVLELKDLKKIYPITAYYIGNVYPEYYGKKVNVRPDPYLEGELQIEGHGMWLAGVLPSELSQEPLPVFN